MSIKIRPLHSEYMKKRNPHIMVVRRSWLIKNAFTNAAFVDALIAKYLHKVIFPAVTPGKKGNKYQYKLSEIEKAYDLEVREQAANLGIRLME